jgi:hypothetical protein
MNYELGRTWKEAVVAYSSDFSWSEWVKFRKSSIRETYVHEKLEPSSNRMKSIELPLD